MKKVLLASTALMLFVAGTAQARYDRGFGKDYPCVNNSNVKVYVGDRHPNPANKGIPTKLENLKELKPEKGCYYGTIDAGAADKAQGSQKCVVALIKKSLIPNYDVTNDDLVEGLCALHIEPETEVKSYPGSLQYGYVDANGRSANAQKWSRFEGQFAAQLKDYVGVATCIPAIAEHMINSYGTKMFCEDVSPVKTDGKYTRLATFDVNLSPGAKSKGPAAAGSDAAVPSAEEGKKEGGKKLMKKLGF